MAHEADQQLFAVDAATQEQRQGLVAQNQATTAAYERRFTENDAINIANFGRAYLNGTPDIAAAVAEAQLDWDMPSLRELMLDDAKQQDGVWASVMKGTRATVRTSIAGVQSVYDEGLGRLTRTGILAYEGHGDNLYENWQRAGSSYLGQAARDIVQGRDVQLGSGWFPGPTPIHEREGFSQELLTNLDAQGFDKSQGIPPDALQTAYRETEQGFIDQYGYSTVQRAWDSQEATIISKTRNGRTYATPFSFGRAPALQIFTPGTIPFNLLSGMIDGTAQIAWDPLNIPAWKLHAAIKSRQLFRPMDLVPPALKAGDELIVPPPKTTPTAPTPIKKAPASGTTWNLGDDIDELRRVQSELDELGTPDWGAPTDMEIQAAEAGRPFTTDALTDFADDHLEELLTIRDAHLEKLGQAGIYIDADTLSVQLLDELGDATKGVSYIEFTDTPARGPLAGTDDIGPGAEGFTFHGSTRRFDPDKPFQGGLSGRADRAAGYAGVEDGQGFVYVYNTDDLPDAVKTHLRDKGDVEQLYAVTGDADPVAVQGLQDDFTELKRLDDDLDELYRRQRDDSPVPWEGETDSFPAAIATPPEIALADEIEALTARINGIQNRMERAAADLGVEAPSTIVHEPITAADMPNPVAVYPVADFQQAMKTGKLKVPGPDVVVPPKPPPTPTNPNPVRPPPQVSPTGSQVGIVDSWRPYSKPVTADQWMREGSGQRLIEYLVDAPNYKVTEILGDLPVDAQKAIVAADNPADIIEILGEHLGFAVRSKPKVPKPFGRGILGATFYGDNLASGAISRVTDGPVGRTYRMFGDTTEALELNPHDTSRTLAAVVRRLEGWGVDAEKIEDIWWAVANADGSTGAMHDAAGKIADLFEDRLLTKRVFGQQYDPIDVKQIMQTFLDDVAVARRYNDDLSGNPIHPEGSRVWTHETPSGAKIELPLDNAHLDSEMAHSSIFLPAGKETRRALSGIRIITDQFRRGAAGAVYKYKTADDPGVFNEALKFIEGSPLGLKRSRGQIVLDAYLAGWRNLALIRLGWVLRYLPDEGLRFLASGELKSPASILIFGFQHGIKDLHGEVLADVLKAQGLGAASFIHRFDDTVAGSRFNAARVNWTTARWGEKGAARGLAREAVQINKSILATTVMERGLDDAFEFFKTARGKEILRPIANDAARNSRLAKMIDDDGILFDVLAEAEMRTAKVAGSEKWIYRNQDDGIWRDAYGNQIDDYTDLEKWPNMQTLREEATRRELPGRSKPKTRDEMRHFLLGDDGYSMLANPDPRRNFYTMDPGSPQARNMMQNGLDEQGNVVIGERMTNRDWTILEESYPGYIESGGYAPPAVVKVPDIKQGNRLQEFGDTFTDAAFRVLGQIPTVNLIRSPFAKVKYTDEIARMYLFGDQASRGRLLKWADEIDTEVTGFRAEFDLMIKKQMRDRNMRSLPKGGVELDIANIDMVAKSIAVEASRDLFYDLSKTHNWADMSRIIWPFADAWWEVISRWAGLINPAKGGGKALLNLRRPQQAIMGAKQSGWFEEDAFGNEVFAWFPQFGTAIPFLSPGTDSALSQVENQVQPSSLLFVDPSDPGSIFKPGFGPPAQVLAALVEPLIPTQVQDEFRKFFFGDFAPPDFSGDGLRGIAGGLAEVHAPTWMRRLGEAWNTESNRTDTSTLTVKLYEALILSGDPRFTSNSPDEAAKVLAHAQAISGKLNWARFLDGLLGPSQQYEAEFWVTVNNTNDPGFWMNTRAVGEELRAAEEWLGTEEAAIEYILERYGFDPLETGASTVFISDFPIGKDGYQYLQDNPEIGEYFPNTMMAWIPESEDVDFYRPAWDASKEFGARIDVTTLNVASIRSATKGNKLYEDLQKERDSMLEQAAVRFPTTSARYQAYANALDDWFGLETLQLGAENGPYWAWGFDRNIGENGAVKPTPRDMLDEISRSAGYRLVITDENQIVITEQATAASAYAAELNPEFHGFVQFMMTRWLEADAASGSLGFRTRWWRSSEARDDERPEAIRQWYIQGLETYIADMESNQNRLGGQYLAERVITPLMAGFDFDEPLVLYTEPPAPPTATSDDTIPQRELVGAPNG